MENVLIKRIEDVPILKSTLRIMKFWSFLLAHNWRRYMCLAPYFLINTSQFLDIYYSTESVDAIIRNAYITVLFFNTLLRAVMLCWKRAEYEAFMEYLRQLYVEILELNVPPLNALLEKDVKSVKLLSKINLTMGTIACFGFVSYPLFATTKVLPFGMHVPIIDKYSSPFYEIFFVLQVIITPSGCCMYIPFTNLIVAFIIFGILMCKVLQYKLRGLKELPRHKVKKELEWCIEYQIKLQRYMNTINGLTTYVFFVEFLTFGAMLCVMLFLFLIVETMAQKVIVSCYIIMIFSQSVVMYYYANELYDQSLGVAIAAYKSNWYEFDVDSQKTIKLFILKAQKPLAILIGNVYIMNLEMLQSLLNATYSYFTLLKRVYG